MRATLVRFMAIISSATTDLILWEHDNLSRKNQQGLMQLEEREDAGDDVRGILQSAGDRRPSVGWQPSSASTSRPSSGRRPSWTCVAKHAS